MKGIPASDGVAIGPVFIWEDKDPVVDKKPIHDTKKGVRKTRSGSGKILKIN